jgi:branched-chain amino acid transport system substrate-binding protein
MKTSGRAPRMAFVVGISVALVAALMSSSADASGGVPAQSGSPSGTPLVIGWIGTQSSSAPTGGSKQGSDTLAAWVKWTNTHGGVNGHPVKAYYEDDKGDPAVASAAIKTLVEDDHVIAVVGSQAGGTEQTWSDYVKSKRVPVIATSQIDALDFTNPMFYGLGGSVITNIWGQMKSAAVAGAKNVGIVLCTEVAACAQAQPLFNADAKSVGLNPVFNVLASQTAPSYTAQCLLGIQNKAQAMAAFINVIQMVRDCSRQNYHPIWINSSGGPTPATIRSAPELGKSVGSTPNWTCTDKQAATNKLTKDYVAAMKKYAAEWAPGGKHFDVVGDSSCLAWTGGIAFAKAITNAGVAASATATNEDVIKGLAMFQNETLGGFTPPINFNDGSKPNPLNKCIYLYKYKGTQLVAVPKFLAYTCQP